MSLYSVGKVIVSGVFSVVFRLKIEGKENLVPGENYLVCANHTSNLDPPMLGVCLPFQARYMAKEELFKIKLFGALIRTLGAFPVKRASRDIAAVKAAISMLEKGESVVIFPEGGRSDGKTLRKGKNGAALVAHRAGVKILPVGISGGYRPFRRTCVRIGKPIDVAEYLGDEKEMEPSQKLQQVTDKKLMPEIARLAGMKMYEC